MTTSPGWYNAQGDPEGTLRYWDGTSWGSDLRSAPPQPPAQPPPAQAQPTAQPQPGASPQRAAMPPATPTAPIQAPGQGFAQPSADQHASQFGQKAAVGMSSHEIDYEIFGDDMQFVEIELDPGETVIGEAGTMMHMEDGIAFESVMGDGTKADGGFFSKMKDAGKRAITGESLFLTHFTHHGTAKAKVAFAAPYPGKIIPIDLVDVGQRLICQKDAFLCAAKGTRIDIAFNRKLGAGFFGGEGFILQDIQGEGKVFIQAGGTITERQLNNETLRIDTGCLVALEPSLTYDIERAGNLKSMVFGGEGMFLATVRGTGKVWLQSLPFARLADRIISTSLRGGNSGEGSVLGGVSTIFER